MQKNTPKITKHLAKTISENEHAILNWNKDIIANKKTNHNTNINCNMTPQETITDKMSTQKTVTYNKNNKNTHP